MIKPEDYTFSPVRSELQMRLDTSFAINLWTGLSSTAGKYPALSFPQYFHILKGMVSDSLSDNPFADEKLFLIESLLSTALDKIVMHRQGLAVQISDSFGEAFSCSYIRIEDPLLIDVYSSSPLGYRSAFLLAQYDSLVKQLLTAHRYGIITQNERHAVLSEMKAAIRRPMNESRRYKRFDVSRQDAVDQTPKWLKALEYFKKVDPEVMDGRKRCSYSPPLPPSSLALGKQVTQSI